MFSKEYKEAQKAKNKESIDFLDNAKTNEKVYTEAKEALTSENTPKDNTVAKKMVYDMEDDFVIAMKSMTLEEYNKLYPPLKKIALIIE